MPTEVDLTYEAVCGGLHKTEFEFLGERGGQAFWTRGTAPEIMRVTVTKSKLGRVILTCEWPNVSSPPRIVKTKLDLTIDCLRPKWDVEAQSIGVMERVLQIFLDILERKGYAGPEYLKKQFENVITEERPEDDLNHESWQDE